MGASKADYGVEDRWFLDDIKSRLMQKDQKKYPQDATAIGSDFRSPVASQQADLERAADCLLSLWRTYRHDPKSRVTLVIAHSYRKLHGARLPRQYL